jgi:excisionase family DNA binding protein
MGTIDLLKPSDIATRLGLTSSRVYQLIAAGEIPCIRMGRAVRIPRPAWEAWLAAQSEQALQSVRKGEVSDAKAE